MDKKFKFKLNGLLKLREFKEKQLKVELGRILQEIQKVKDEIVVLGENIGEAYASQEKILKSHVKGEVMKFYPQYVKGQRADVSMKQNYLYALERKYERTVLDMKTAMGEVKVIENLKEKKKLEHKKKIDKKMNEDIEEMVIMRREQA